MDISTLLNDARKNRDPNGIRAYSRVLAAIQTARGRTGKEPTEAEVLKIIAGEVAVLNEEIGFCHEGDFEQMNDLAESALILGKLLPKKIDPSEYEAIVIVAMVITCAYSKKDMSKVMKQIAKDYGTTVDMKVIGELVKAELK